MKSIHWCVLAVLLMCTFSEQPKNVKTAGFVSCSFSFLQMTGQAWNESYSNWHVYILQLRSRIVVRRSDDCECGREESCVTNVVALRDTIFRKWENAFSFELVWVWSAVIIVSLSDLSWCSLQRRWDLSMQRSILTGCRWFMFGWREWGCYVVYIVKREWMTWKWVVFEPVCCFLLSGIVSCLSVQCYAFEVFVKLFYLFLRIWIVICLFVIETVHIDHHVYQWIG